MLKKIGLCLLIAFLCVSCKSEMERNIIGKWYAASLVECEEIVPIDVSLVNLEFRGNGKYTFNSTLNLHEEGKYRIKGNYLYTKDLIKEKAIEKAVRIVKLNADTLELEMNYRGKEQFLTLLHVMQADKEESEGEEEIKKTSVDTTTAQR